MEELGKITESKYVSLETKAKITHTLVPPITMHRCECWTGKKADKKNWTYLKQGDGAYLQRVSTDTLEQREDEHMGSTAN